MITMKFAGTEASARASIEFAKEFTNNALETSKHILPEGYMAVSNESEENRLLLIIDALAGGATDTAEKLKELEEEMNVKLIGAALIGIGATLIAVAGIEAIRESQIIKKWRSGKA